MAEAPGREWAGPADVAEWCEQAVWELMAAGFGEEQAVAAVREARSMAALAGRPLEDLFDEPLVFAANLPDLEGVSWLDRVIREEDPEPDADADEERTARGLVLVSLGLAIAAVVPVTVGAFVVAGWRVPYSWGLLLLPLSLCSSAVLGFWLSELLLLRVPRWTAVPASTAAGLALFAGWQALAPVLSPRAVFAHAAPLWLLLLLPGYGLLLWLASRLLREREGAASDGGGRNAPWDDAAWCRRARGLLRLDCGMTEHRARNLVKDARAMAAAAERPTAEMFGPPREFARRFAHDDRASARRSLWRDGLWCVAAVVACAVQWAAAGRVEWWLVLATLVALAAAGWAWGIGRVAASA